MRKRDYIKLAIVLAMGIIILPMCYMQNQDLQYEKNQMAKLKRLDFNEIERLFISSNYFATPSSKAGMIAITDTATIYDCISYIKNSKRANTRKVSTVNAEAYLHFITSAKDTIKVRLWHTREKGTAFGVLAGRRDASLLNYQHDSLAFLFVYAGYDIPFE